jgi:hypothetical protein
MSHFAKVLNGKVIDVIVAEPEFFDEFVDSSPGEWIQTSYNTIGGVHKLGGTPLRKNYAGVGYTYDYARDAFIPPQPYPSWTLNETSCLWDAPVVRPTDKQYVWDEETVSWKPMYLGPNATPVEVLP